MRTTHPYPAKIKGACAFCGTVRRLRIFARTPDEYIGLCAICREQPDNQEGGPVGMSE